MIAERFDILRKEFKKGLNVDLKTFKIYNNKGKEIEYIRENNKDYVIINNQIWWVPMVISAFVGLDVIGNTWIPKDDNWFNYHPGNALLLNQEEKEKYYKNKSKCSISWKDLDAIKSVHLYTKKINYLKKISNFYGVPLSFIKKIKYYDNIIFLGFSLHFLKKYNKMI